MLNSQRITSLCLSNPFIVDVIFSPVRIASNFTRLETLIVDNIKSKYLINILNYLSFLPNFSSLVLKYCKISLKEYSDFYSLPISTNVISPIEHFVVTHQFCLNNLNALLSYISQVRRLAFHCLDERNSDINFDKFELMIKSLFSQLQILHLTTNYDKTFVDSNRWEQ
ncbi:unnamed protein product [Rotaria sp. Silwood2]|nr:unnamed protein product [Rotaria sp. Silwood2]